MLLFILPLVVGSFICGWKAAKRWYGYCQRFPWTMVIAAGVGIRLKWFCDTGVQHEYSEGKPSKETQCSRPDADPRAIEKMTIDAIRDELRIVYRLQLVRNWTKIQLVEKLRDCREGDRES